MKKVLIVYDEMVIGGSTTSLLSILNNLDYAKYTVDLLLKHHRGDLFNSIPKKVNILPPVLPHPMLLKIKKVFSPICVYNYLKVKIIRSNVKQLQLQQIYEKDYARLSYKLEQEYDIAISFLELWSTYYVANSVRAKRKFAWIHVDYNEAGFLPKIDTASFEKLDKIIVVAKACLNSMVNTFPQFGEKVEYIENILSDKVIRTLANEPVNYHMDPQNVNISTVCRIVFEHKGLDRGVKAFSRLKNENLCNNVSWHIIGDGPDYYELVSLIKRYGLENHIFLLGKKTNPHKYVINSDFFFLPSRYEGKPMAVTEAMMLGIPPVVTEYASAREQIEDGVDGLVLNNDDESIYEGLKNILLDPTLIIKLKNNVNNRNYSNLEEFYKVINLIESPHKSL